MVLRTVCAMATGHPKLSMCYTAHLGRQCCLLSSSPGPSWNPLLDFLCWAAVAAPAVGCLPARTDRSPPWGPLLELVPEHSLAVWSPSSSRLVAVPMRRSKNVPPGREMQACDWGETRRRREGGRETLCTAAGPVVPKNALKPYRKLDDMNFKTMSIMSHFTHLFL